MLEKRLNHDAIQTKAQIFKNHLARDILFLRRRSLYPAELYGHITFLFYHVPPFRQECFSLVFSTIPMGISFDSLYPQAV